MSSGQDVGVGGEYLRRARARCGHADLCLTPDYFRCDALNHHQNVNVKADLVYTNILSCVYCGVTHFRSLGVLGNILGGCLGLQTKSLMIFWCSKRKILGFIPLYR